MKLFHAYAHTNALEVCIVARSGSHAAEIFLTYWTGEYGDAPGAFDITANVIPYANLRPELQYLIKGSASGVLLLDESHGARLVPM